MPEKKFIQAVTDLVYTPKRREAARERDAQKYERLLKDVDHPYIYHGSGEKIPVGSFLEPRPTHNPPGSTLLFGTKRKAEAQRYARYKSMKTKEDYAERTGKKIPANRKAGWVYVVEQTDDWINQGPEGELGEHTVERPQKIIARERVVLPRHQVPVTRNELIGTAAVGGAAMASATSGYYYYRHRNNKLERVKNTRRIHHRDHA